MCRYTRTPLPICFVFLFQVGLKEVEDILRDVDLNGDGLVDFEGISASVNCLFNINRCCVQLHFVHAPPVPSCLAEFVRMMSR